MFPFNLIMSFSSTVTVRPSSSLCGFLQTTLMTGSWTSSRSPARFRTTCMQIMKKKRRKGRKRRREITYRGGRWRWVAVRVGNMRPVTLAVWLSTSVSFLCCRVVFAQVFFTRNGKVVGRREVGLPVGGFYPTIGMMSTGEKVRVDLHPLSGWAERREMKRLELKQRTNHWAQVHVVIGRAVTPPRLQVSP